MKKRAHVLHAMLAGCVQVGNEGGGGRGGGVPSAAPPLTARRFFGFRQRKDYSVLAEFLPPKQEYVLAVRITPLQHKLYRYYLDHITSESLSPRSCVKLEPDGQFSFKHLLFFFFVFFCFCQLWVP